MRDPLALDPTLLMSVLVKHKTGLHLLASDYDGLREASVPPDKIGRLCKLAQSLFPTVVVDCGTVLNSAVTMALTSATTILLVVTLEVPTMRRAVRMMEALNTLGHGRERVILVLNRSRREDQGLQEEAEALLGQPVACLFRMSLRRRARRSRPGACCVPERAEALLSVRMNDWRPA
jgi:pilus assembly protein CpaE